MAKGQRHTVTYDETPAHTIVMCMWWIIESHKVVYMQFLVYVMIDLKSISVILAASWQVPIQKVNTVYTLLSRT